MNEKDLIQVEIYIKQKYNNEIRIKLKFIFDGNGIHFDICGKTMLTHTFLNYKQYIKNKKLLTIKIVNMIEENKGENMKMKNCGFKSEYEMAISIIKDGPVFIENREVSFINKYNKEKIFIIKSEDYSKYSPLKNYWCKYNIAERQTSIKDRIKAGEKVFCWVNSSFERNKKKAKNRAAYVTGFSETRGFEALDDFYKYAFEVTKGDIE